MSTDDLEDPDEHDGRKFVLDNELDSDKTVGAEGGSVLTNGDRESSIEGDGSGSGRDSSQSSTPTLSDASSNESCSTTDEDPGVESGLCFTSTPVACASMYAGGDHPYARGGQSWSGGTGASFQAGGTGGEEEGTCRRK